MGITYTKQPVKAVISDVTASRAVDTVYQNTTGRPLLVLVTMLSLRTADGEIAEAQGTVEDVTPPTVVQCKGGLSQGAIVESAEIAYFQLAFAVPNNQYYKVVTQVSGSAVLTMDTWIEVEL